jgi:hypothetical protein
MPSAFVREFLKNRLGEFRYSRTRSDSYDVFRFFYPSLIANYNHDGLASAYCRPRHRVLEMHGTVGRHCGAPEMGPWLTVLRDFDIALPPDDLIMVEREASTASCDVKCTRRVYLSIDTVDASPNDSIAQTHI